MNLRDWAAMVGTFALAICLGGSGCSRKPTASTEIEKATAELSKNPPAATAAETPAAPAAQPNVPAPAQTAPVPAPAQQMNQAVSAYKAGNLEEAVTRMHTLRASPVLTPQQRIALNDAMAAVMSEIYAAAAKGDTKAIAAVKQYEYMQSRPR